MKRVLITGGTGLIGKRLIGSLQAKGYKIAVLSRKKSIIPGTEVFVWDYKSGILDLGAIQYSDIIIHLAGAGIASTSWSHSGKKEILESRVNSAQFLLNILKKNNCNPGLFISASGTGYYGSLTSQHIYKEGDPPGDDFAARVCKEWEKAADQFLEISNRVVKIRTAPVLTAEGGVIKKLLPLINSGLASPLGSGNQYFPWVHIDDLVGIYMMAIENEFITGTYNASAPEYILNSEFLQSFAKIRNKPFFLPSVPGFILKLALGERAGMLLEGSRVSTEKIRDAGFNFRFPSIIPALKIYFRDNLAISQCLTNIASKLNMMDQFSISDLSRFSGIRPHTIRIWEQRYEALKPSRSEGNVRFYDGNQLRRLLNIVSLMDSDYKISELCSMPDKKLFKMIEELKLSASSTDIHTGYFISQLVDSALTYNEEQFDKLYSHAVLRYGMPAAYTDIIYPLLDRLGIMWSADKLPPAQEHFISNLLRQKLFSATDMLPPAASDASSWLLFLPEDEYHELGLLFANYLIRSKGRRTYYMGSSFPLSVLNKTVSDLKPDYLYFFLVHYNDVIKTQEYLNEISAMFSKKKIMVSGHGKLLSEIKMPSNITVLTSVNSLELLLV